MSRTKPWELSDAMWERAQPLLPPQKPHPKGGRPPRADRQMLGAMLYVLRTASSGTPCPTRLAPRPRSMTAFAPGNRTASLSGCGWQD